jgi:hypothetical protein
MATPTTKTELLVTGEHELVKVYQLLDGQNRPYKIYTASTNAVDGDPCLVTEIVYVSPTSTAVLAQKDGYDEWDSTWIPDSSFTVSVALDANKAAIIKTLENEMNKQYQEIDGQDRPYKLYEALVSTIDGGPCKVTEFIYQNATSTTILGKKEAYAEWDITWVPDSAFTVNY